MKLPIWNEQKKSWDAFKTFHIGITKNDIRETSPGWDWGNWNAGMNFIMFDTGELIYRPINTRPHCRGLNKQLNIGIYRTKDHDCPTLYTLDGRKVPKMQLNHRGSQLILVDYDTGQAFSVNSWYWNEGKKGPAAPTRFTEDRQNRAYWPSAGLPPVNIKGDMIEVKRPARHVLDKEQMEHIDTILTTARAAMALTDHPQTKKHYWGRGTGVPAEELLKVEKWDDLDDNMLHRLYHVGVERYTEKHEYLTIFGGE
jgi:hypothetical protein